MLKKARHMTMSGLACGVLATAALSATPAYAADSYPQKPVRIMVGFSAGGAVDNVARQISAPLAAQLGQSFVIENQTGATGTIAAETAARASSDGHTLLVATQSTMIVAPHMYSLRFTPLEDLKPVALIGSVPLALVAHPSVGIKTVADMIELAKASDGQLVYASSGAGGPQHLAAELFSTMADVSMVHVPYRGEANAISDLLGNHVPLMFSNLPTLLPHIQSGLLQGIAVTGSSRAASAPDLPTVAEAGLPGFEAETWFALFAPAGTSDAIVEKLAASVKQALEQPDIQTSLSAQGLTINFLSGNALADYLQAEKTKLTQLAETAKLKPE